MYDLLLLVGICLAPHDDDTRRLFFHRLKVQRLLTTWAIWSTALQQIIHPFIDVLFVATFVLIASTGVFYVQPGRCLYKAAAPQ